MRLSRYFLPTLRETPKEAEIVSHRLMLRAGMIRQQSAGIYAWLPIGLKVLDKINRIVREEQNRAGAVEILMPTIQSADLWRESGRYEAYGKEMLRIKDRHGRDMLYGPTNEEMVTEIFRSFVKSYKDLPLNLYHIQWKFRDEVRPRFGVMRGREFLMKDAYSFDIDQAGARHAYNRMFTAYLRTFARLGLKAIPMRADTGPIGGDLSHEFIVLAATGESEVFCHSDFLDFETPAADTDFDSIDDLHGVFEKWTSLYAATEEMHDSAAYEAIPADKQLSARGIEVGHIFYFGTKYSEPMGATVAGPDGVERPVHMGSYGIGPSRLVAALIEASHDENGIIWPEAVAPFQVAVLNLKVGDAGTDGACKTLYDGLTKAGVDVLYDDRDERPGTKFATADLIGVPWQVIVGPKGLAEGKVELKQRAGGERELLTVDAALGRLAQRFGGVTCMSRDNATTRVFAGFEWMLAGRYLRTRRREGFVSVIAGFSFLGIMLGVATLIIVMSVMNGFRKELLEKIVGVNGHIFLTSIERPLDDYVAVAEKLRAIPGVRIAIPMVEGQALISSQTANSGVLIRGLAEADLKSVRHVSDNIRQGTLDGFDTGGGIAIGKRLAESLSVRAGDSVTVVTPRGAATPFGTAPRIKAYPVAAVFEIGMSEFDASFVFMPMEELQAYFNREGDVNVIELFIDNPDRTQAVRNAIETNAPRPLAITDWRQRNRSFFSALEVERNVMFLILTLIVLVAALNIVSGLIMLVKDKTSDIAILRTMGATRGAVLRIFLITGASIGIVGTIAGFILGITFANNIQSIMNAINWVTGADLWDPTVRFLSEVPSVIDWREVGTVIMMALVLSLLATLYPAWKAARLDPVEALRYG